MSNSTKKVVNRLIRKDAKVAPDFECTKTIRRPWDTSGYSRIAEDILGAGYSLSLVLIGDSKSKALNSAYRNKKKPANVLSFPLTPHAGEIFLNIPRAVREADQYAFSPTQHARFLFIHGCLHLRGYDHGSTMDRAERKYIRKYILR